MARLSAGAAALIAAAGLVAPAAALDTPSPQVNIEARFVAVGADDVRDLGFDFRLLTLPTEPAGTQPFTVILPSGDDPVPPDGILAGLPSAQLLGQVAQPGGAGEATEIHAGGELPAGDLVGPDAAAGTPATLPFGLRLRVLPQPAEDGLIRMTVEPVVTEFAPPGGAGGDPAPGLVTRRATTQVAVPDGGTILIGGLFSETTREKGATVPVLGDLPLVGRLFRSRDEAASRTSLLILVTPTIIDEEGGGGGGGGVAAAPTPAEEETVWQRIDHWFLSLSGRECQHVTRPCDIERRLPRNALDQRHEREPPR